MCNYNRLVFFAGLASLHLCVKCSRLLSIFSHPLPQGA
jgi:hypothetical protein